MQSELMFYINPQSRGNIVSRILEVAVRPKPPSY